MNLVRELGGSQDEPHHAVNIPKLIPLEIRLWDARDCNCAKPNASSDSDIMIRTVPFLMLNALENRSFENLADPSSLFTGLWLGKSASVESYVICEVALMMVCSGELLIAVLVGRQILNSLAINKCFSPVKHPYIFHADRRNGSRFPLVATNPRSGLSLRT